MNFFMLIPGIFTFLEKIVGPLLPAVKGSIVSSVLGSDGTHTGIMGAIQGVLGDIENEKVAAINEELKTLLGQIELNKLEESKDSKTFTPRTTFFWALAGVMIYHLAFAELANTVAWFHGAPFAPLDTLTVSLMFGLLGIYHVGKTIEKVNSNQDS